MLMVIGIFGDSEQSQRIHAGEVAVELETQETRPAHSSRCCWPAPQGLVCRFTIRHYRSTGS